MENATSARYCSLALPTSRYEWNQSYSYSKHCRTFAYSRITSIDLDHWDVSNVTDFSYSLASYDLDTLNISSWDTGSATTMSGMFRSTNLTSLDLSHFDTRNVINMSSMFSGMSHIASNDDLVIDGDNWDTSNVRDFNYMFYGMTSLPSLDISHLDIINSTTNLAYMFGYTPQMTSLTIDETKWDTSNVTNFSGMFYYTNLPNTFDMGFLDTSSATNMSRMFSHVRYECYQLGHNEI